jgi:predicted enzyme related to lactoylglutathione lyase
MDIAQRWNTNRRSQMFDERRAFSSYSVSDASAARQFYAGTLGLSVSERPEMGVISIDLGGRDLMLYAKPDHEPASYTVLNFRVDAIEQAVDELSRRGVRMEHYEGFEQDEKGIARPSDPAHGPPIAWFTDPSGNVLAVIEDGR